MLLRTRARQIERELHDPVDALTGEHAFLEHDFALGALEHPPTDRRVFPFGVLAHDDEVDVARLAIRERCRDAGHQAARPQVHVLVETAPELDQRSPQRHVIGNRRGPADGPVIDRLEALQLLEPVLGHHPAVKRVIVRAPVVMGEREVDAEFFRGRLDDALTFRHDFLADAVAGHHGDSVRRHPFLRFSRPL